MEVDELSIGKHISQLKQDIYDYTLDVNFKKCKTMGDIVRNALDFVKRNYESVNAR